MDEFVKLLHEQQGLISRRQVLACGLDDAFIVRCLRRRELARVLDGVYVNHTGELNWLQRAWAAVLFYWPAALTHVSALQMNGMRRAVGEDDPIHIAVDHCRRVTRQPGIALHRVRDLTRLIQPSRQPHRVRLEHAVLDVASDAKTDSDAIAVLADSCQSYKTTAARLAKVLRQRIRLSRRSFMLEVLEDVATGAYSVLEHRYLTRVERPHGLPTAKRQRWVSIGRSVAHRDVEYLGLVTVVELDGRLGHEEANDRWDDLDRDIDTAREGKTTVRISWKQVESPCRTAAAVAAILTVNGWSSQPSPCSSGCPVGPVRGDNSTPGDESSPQTRREDVS